ncbi:hypothetical protein JOB18_042925 [Solea senegalensis]|uniref:Uncharacterized protein n=1 Tax=Solea senegalensis TaxID=28829 RepID=A0AAV6RQT2_SOLSE|nr:hypothetical protein JOB18_042925 [Solea senegalensis]
MFQYIFPALVLSIAVVLLCFYMHAKKRRAAYDVSRPTAGDDNTGAEHSAAMSGEDTDADVNRCYDTFPPRYSTVDHPPPYSLFDPKLTGIWPADLLPAYEMYPIMLPLASYQWMTPAEHPS